MEKSNCYYCHGHQTIDLIDSKDMDNEIEIEIVGDRFFADCNLYPNTDFSGMKINYCPMCGRKL